MLLWIGYLNQDGSTKLEGIDSNFDIVANHDDWFIFNLKQFPVLHCMVQT